MKYLKDQYNYFLAACSPAQFYMVVSLISIVGILLQNLVESYKFCLGNYTCSLDYSNIFVFLVKIAYVVVWTIILESLCKTGNKKLAWGLVLFPYVLMFVLLALFMI